jgi:hypothetical protein
METRIGPDTTQQSISGRRGARSCRAGSRSTGGGGLREVEGDLFDGDWHLYGGEVGPEWVTIYYERREAGRFPTLAEFRHPLFILADLALHGKQPRTTDQPADMQIDYIHVWQTTGVGQQ